MADALTLTSTGGLLRVIASECHICPGYSSQGVPAGQHPAFQSFPAIWDTGASASVISQLVVDRCGLKPTGMTKSHTANGVFDTETYVVNIKLINGVSFENLTVTRGILPSTEVLIGMDVLTQGDLALTNFGGKTIFTFRTPSLGSVDYVKELNAQNRHSGGGGGSSPKRFGMFGKRRRK